MTIDKLIDFIEVSKSVDQLPWEYSLYIPKSAASWQADMPCMILDPEVTDDPDDIPDVAKGNNLKYALTVAAVQDVADNLKNQGVRMDFDSFSKGVKYYYENDAFITMSAY